MAMAVMEKEKRFWELDEILLELDGELRWAQHLGCSDLIDDGVLEDYHQVTDAFWKLSRELEAEWYKDNSAVSPKLSKWFEEQERLYEEMANNTPDWVFA